MIWGKSGIFILGNFKFINRLVSIKVECIGLMVPEIL